MVPKKKDSKKTTRFSLRSKIGRSSGEVFDWLIQSSRYKRLIPPWEKVGFLSFEGDPRAVGFQVILKIKIGSFSRRMIIQRKELIEKESFTDVQVQGPFKHWEHIHRIHSTSDGECEVEDEIQFAAPFPFLHSRIEKREKRKIEWQHERLNNDLQVQSRYEASRLRILVSGSKGLVGSDLCSFLQSAGHQVVSLTRKKGNRGQDTIFWNPKSGEIAKEDFEDFDAVIHLAGKNIGSGFWTKKFKEEIFLSRCRDTWLLSQVLLRLFRPPKTIICASAVGIYGNRGDEELTEESPPGTGFLANLCQKWEESTTSIENRGTRGVHTRFGLILSSKGGMLAKIFPLFRLGFGAIIGSGKQWMSWISLDDVVYGLYHTLMTKEIEGPVNFTAPEAVTNASFSKKLSAAMHKPLFFRIGEKPLHFFLGEMADEMFLASARARPEKLETSGYQFYYPTLEQALSCTLFEL